MSLKITKNILQLSARKQSHLRGDILGLFSTEVYVTYNKPVLIIIFLEVMSPCQVFRLKGIHRILKP